jgi:hypothetical protein
MTGAAAAKMDGANSRKMVSSVDCFSFQGLRMSDGEPVKDLNGLLKISTDSYGRNARAIIT